MPVRSRPWFGPAAAAVSASRKAVTKASFRKVMRYRNPLLMFAFLAVCSVLDDGIPLNDPFGGWVYWGRVPRVAIDRIEVVRGGASDLYGSGAMGGVVQFIRRTNDDVAVETSAGNEGTGTASMFAAMTRGDWDGSIDADFLTTSGYVLVQPSQRGIVDVEADARHTTVDGVIRHSGFFLRLSHY